MKFKQLFCRHKYADKNLHTEIKDGICIFTNRCVKCGKEYRAEISERDLYLSTEDFGRKCKDCANYHTMRCPNSIKCASTIDKPYFVEKAK